MNGRLTIVTETQQLAPADGPQKGLPWLNKNSLYARSTEVLSSEISMSASHSLDSPAQKHETQGK